MDKQTSDLIIGAYAVLMFFSAGAFLIGALLTLFVGTALGVLFLSLMSNLLFLSGAVTAIGIVFFSVFLLISIFSLFTALGLWNRRGWSRIAIVLVCAMSLFNFPFGTIIGGFGIWFFGIEKSTEKLFKKRKR